MAGSVAEAAPMKRGHLADRPGTGQNSERRSVQRSLATSMSLGCPRHSRPHSVPHHVPHRNWGGGGPTNTQTPKPPTRLASGHRPTQTKLALDSPGTGGAVLGMANAPVAATAPVSQAQRNARRSARAQWLVGGVGGCGWVGAGRRCGVEERGLWRGIDIPDRAEWNRYGDRTGGANIGGTKRAGNYRPDRAD